MKMPPLSKIYEAFSAIADDRVKISSNFAIVLSSNREKEYHIYWNNYEFSSDDNATYWQQYPGYPVIAVWFLLGVISYNEIFIPFFKNINWYELNKKNKRDYDKSVNDVLKSINDEIFIADVKAEVLRIYDNISSLSYKIVRKVKSN